MLQIFREAFTYVPLLRTIQKCPRSWSAGTEFHSSIETSPHDANVYRILGSHEANTFPAHFKNFDNLSAKIRNSVPLDVRNPKIEIKLLMHICGVRQLGYVQRVRSLQ